MKILNACKETLCWRSKKTMLILLGLFLFPNILTATKMPPDWTLDATVNNVDFYHSIVECGGRKVVLLKFNNKNNKAASVSWKEVFITQQQNANKTEGPFKVKHLVLLPGETSESDCENIKQNQLLARPNQHTPVYDARIVKFNFKDIKVTVN